MVEKTPKDKYELYAMMLVTPKASIYRSSPIKEEVEEENLEEVSKGTGTGQPNNPNMYRVEYYSTAKDPGWYTHMETTDGKDAFEKMNSLIKMGLRARMIEPGKNKTNVKEEIEELDEISKEKLKNYAKKSAYNLADKGNELAYETSREDKYRKAKKIAVRAKYHDIAVDKISEEIEELMSKGFTEEEAIAILDQMNDKED